MESPAEPSVSKERGWDVELYCLERFRTAEGEGKAVLWEQEESLPCSSSHYSEAFFPQNETSYELNITIISIRRDCSQFCADFHVLFAMFTG